MASGTDGPDLQAVTASQQATWTTGDFHEIARQNVTMAEALCEAVELHAGERVLDVACGSGTAALVAARRYCEVADAQALPFDDDSFDVVVSVYGVQFAPDQQLLACTAYDGPDDAADPFVAIEVDVDVHRVVAAASSDAGSTACSHRTGRPSTSVEPRRASRPSRRSTIRDRS